MPHTEANGASPIPAIAVRDLVKNFDEVRAVRGVNFEVAVGEVFGFLGPERRRQDDDDQHALHARQAHLGRRARGRA